MYENFFLLFLILLIFVNAIENWEWRSTPECRDVQCPEGYSCHRPNNGSVYYVLPIICVKDGMNFNGIFPPLADFDSETKSTEIMPFVTLLKNEETTLTSSPMTLIPTTVSIFDSMLDIKNDENTKQMFQILYLILGFVTIALLLNFCIFVQNLKSHHRINRKFVNQRPIKL